MISLKQQFATVSLIFLAACSGGGGGAIVGFDNLNDNGDYDALQSAWLELYTEHYGSGPTLISNLPAGRHTYSGVAGFTEHSLTTIEVSDTIVNTGSTANITPSYMSGDEAIPEPLVLGAIHLDMDFENDSATGVIKNLQSSIGYEIEGEIDINATILRNVVSGTFVGDLNEEGTQKVVAGDVTGVFVGSDAGGFYGDLTQAGNSASDADGFFFTSRNR